MLVLLAKEGVDLQISHGIAFRDVVLVPLELGQLFDGPTDVAQAFCSRLGVFVDALDGPHAQFGHESAEKNAEWGGIYPLLSSRLPVKPSFRIQFTSREGVGVAGCKTV
jgi:hypothetical protein